MQLGVGPIDHADEALQSFLARIPAQRRFDIAQVKQEGENVAVVAQALDAVLARRLHIHERTEENGVRDTYDEAAQ